MSSAGQNGVTRPIVERHATEGYGREQPVGEQPVGEQPVGEQPVGEQPVGEQPVGEQPVGEQQGVRTVLAALDASAAARPVLETALGLARLTGAGVEAVHVTDGSVETPESLARRHDVPLRLLDGPVEPALLAALAGSAAIAAVVGARATPGGRRPTGRSALRIMEGASKPVVVVPPDALAGSPRTFRRLLVPLEGSEPSSRSVAEGLCPLIVNDVELFVLHVFTAATMPRLLDRPARDLQLLGGEFLARYLPGAARIELRTGSVGRQVEAVCREEDVDLVVLSWSQDSSAGHAAVISDVLSHATVPVLLLPV